MNFIYEFEVMIEKEVSKTKTETEENKEIVITTKNKELVPVYFAFKKASRGDREEVETERAATWSKAVERGIMTEAMALKYFNNQGGILSDEQKKDYNDCLAAIESKRIELKKLETDEKTPEAGDKEKIEKEIEIFNQKLLAYQRLETAFFENTAETKARLRAIEWLVLNLSYFKEDKAKNWEPFFKGKDSKEKSEYSEKLEEESNELYIKTRDKLTIIAALFLNSGNSLKKEDIEKFA